MHDLDRTQLEQYEYEGYGQGELEGEDFIGDLVGSVLGGELESPLTPEQEMGLATELLEVTSEQELDRFLGDVFRTVASAAGRFARSDTGRQLGGILKSAVKQALPTVGQGIGDWVAPGKGGAIGSKLASQAGRVLGLELEGLSPQDREFEAARQFVRFAAAANHQAAQAPPSAPAPAVARAAARVAARTFAPGLVQAPALAPGGSAPGAQTGSSGRWVRRGNHIVLLGA
jgi:hypothetical protein